MSTLARSLKISVDSVKVLHRDLIFSNLAVIFLLETTKLCLVSGFNLNNGSLQLFNGTLVVLPVTERTSFITGSGLTIIITIIIIQIIIIY